MNNSDEPFGVGGGGNLTTHDLPGMEANEVVVGGGNLTTLVPPPPPSLEADYAMVHEVLTWFNLPQFIMCVFGNVLIVIVMNMPRNKRLTTATYFSAIAISDIIFMTQTPFTIWLDRATGVDVFASFDQKLVMIVQRKILTFSNLEISIWLLVAMTVDRLICVMYPHRSRYMCTVFKARVVVVIIVLAFVGLNCFLILFCVELTTNKGMKMPIIVDAVPNGSTVVRWCDLGFVFILPFVINSFGTIVIIIALKRSQNLRRSSAVGRSTKSSVKGNANRSATMNLIAANITFLITVLPLHILLLHEPSMSPSMFHVLRVAFQVIFHLNAVLNFYLYILRGTRFRKDVKGILCTCKYKGKETRTFSQTLSLTLSRSSDRTNGPERF